MAIPDRFSFANLLAAPVAAQMEWVEPEPVVG
jgi:hypothetical protein